MHHIFQIKDNALLLHHQEFNQTIGQCALVELRRKAYGCITTVQASGKIFIIGDLHEQVDILLDIFAHIQSIPDNNLDLNPNNKIIFLGDIITPTKSFLSTDTVVGLNHANPDTLRGDSITRAIISLIARYPNQIIPINGNHEMGFYLSSLLEKRPRYCYHPLLLQDVLSSHPIGSASVQNYKFYTQIIELLPMAILIQQQAQQHLVMHSPGAFPLPTCQELFNTKHITDWLSPKTDIFLNVLRGHGDITKIHEYAKHFDVNTIFFGHAAPDGLSIATKERRWNKTDNNSGALGFGNASACFVDSQTRTHHSGYICLDFINNKKSVTPMPSITTKHSCSESALKATLIPKPPEWSKQWQYITKTLY